MLGKIDKINEIESFEEIGMVDPSKTTEESLKEAKDRAVALDFYSDLYPNIEDLSEPPKLTFIPSKRIFRLMM